jgi:hypothetical protein
MYGGEEIMFSDAGFLAYADHCVYLDSIVDRIVAGETDISVRDTVSEADLEYIQKEVEKRLG